jgi:hypothetical protein
VHTATGYLRCPKAIARGFDPVRLQLGAGAHPVAEQVAFNAFNIAALSASGLVRLPTEPALWRHASVRGSIVPGRWESR